MCIYLRLRFGLVKIIILIQGWKFVLCDKMLSINSVLIAIPNLRLFCIYVSEINELAFEPVFLFIPFEFGACDVNS